MSSVDAAPTPTPSLGKDIRDGVRDVVPIMLAVTPYAVVFGAFALDRGLTPFETLLASISIYGAASQYAMVDLMGHDVPVWSILLSVFAVNARHVLYSASLQPVLGQFSWPQKLAAFFLLVDPQYASSHQRAHSTGLRPAYYFAYGLTLYLSWVGANILGILFGGLIGEPSRFGLDLLLPMFFMCLVFGFRHKPRFAVILGASVGAALAAYYLIGSPWHITLGGLSGILTAAFLSQPDQEDAA